MKKLDELKSLIEETKDKISRFEEYKNSSTDILVMQKRANALNKEVKSIIDKKQYGNGELYWYDVGTEEIVRNLLGTIENKKDLEKAISFLNKTLEGDKNAIRHLGKRYWVFEYNLQLYHKKLYALEREYEVVAYGEDAGQAFDVSNGNTIEFIYITFENAKKRLQEFGVDLEESIDENNYLYLNDEGETGNESNLQTNKESAGDG